MLWRLFSAAKSLGMGTDMRNIASDRALKLTESVIREMTRICLKHQGVNLAQGFPDFPAPAEIKEAALKAIQADLNQYAITWGTVNLRQAIAEKFAWYNGVTIDPEREITVCCGSTEAMISSLMAIVNSGEEVIVFEPFYETMVRIPSSVMRSRDSSPSTNRIGILMNRNRRTQLYEVHKQTANMTVFASFEMPLWYKDVLPEHLAVRNSVGVFDISHMGRVLVTGSDSERFLNSVITNDVSRLASNDAQYSVMCNENGKIWIVFNGEIFNYRELREYLIKKDIALKLSPTRKFWFNFMLPSVKTACPC
jgi:hypothetical protein